jgi:hypothetical protein
MLSVMLESLPEGNVDGWVLWLEHRSMVANPAFAFPTERYLQMGKEVVLFGDQDRVARGDAWGASWAARLHAPVQRRCDPTRGGGGASSQQDGPEGQRLERRPPPVPSHGAACTAWLCARRRTALGL